MNTEVMWCMIERVKVLADYPMATLRLIAAGFGCDDQPSAREAKKQLGHESRGNLIATIISHEFDTELTKEQ